MGTKIAQADACSIPIRSESVDSIITSPPYWSQRVYGDDRREIGKNNDLELDYLPQMHAVAQECFRVLKDTGSMWLVIGDTYSGSGGAGGDYTRGEGRYGSRIKYKQGHTDVPKQSLCFVPHRVAMQFMSVGFKIRSAIVWDKESFRPESVHHTRRPMIQHEFIFFMTKGKEYTFHSDQFDRIGEKGDVWHIKPARRSSSIAPFPDEIARRAILLSTDPGDIVFDPFLGGGTTADVANGLARKGLGMDLYYGS